MDKEEYSRYEEATQISRLRKLAADNPMLPVGGLAFFAVVGHGIYNFKRKNMRPSLYLIHYRVVAQGTFLGCITLGLAYSLFKKHVWSKWNKDKNDG